MNLRIFLNLDNLTDLRPGSLFPPALVSDPAGRDARLQEDGFAGVQLTHDDPEPGTLLPYCGLGRVNHPDEADALLARRARRGDLCVTLHVGWGMEDDAEVDALVRAILKASQKYQLPAYIETHRATITQDMWRTVQITKRFPEVRFNLDLSHLYCGQEMVYGDWAAKLDFLQPVFDRTRFIHGRIAAPGWMQAPIDGIQEKPALAHGVDYLAHFREAWTRAMAAFRAHAAPGEELIFAPELLPAGIYYARKFPDAAGHLVEETDRYEQALRYRDLAAMCWRDATSAK
jgi:hypothetical protein